jgi:c-di-AMP phosphodiesterase-like protein
MTHTPDKRQDLIEQVSATIEGLSIIDGENVVLSWAEDDLLRVSSVLADFILARERDRDFQIVDDIAKKMKTRYNMDLNYGEFATIKVILR